MKVGIIGLEYAGKRSLFSLLTGIPVEGYASAKDRIGVVDVPDGRIDSLADHYQTRKKVYSKIEFSLTAPVKKDAAEKGVALLEAKETDMLAVVVRQFADDGVFHPLGGGDPVRDYAVVKEELLFADLILVETRLERIEKQMKVKKTDLLAREQELMLAFRAQIEAGNYLHRVPLDVESQKLVKSLAFLTMKPLFAVVNCDEDRLADTFSFPDGIKSINISTKIEQEIQRLDEISRKEFLSSLSLEQPSLDRLIRFAYAYGDLISFITAGPQESHSWTIRNGTTALKAAGAIHSDIEKGFIRAEVVSFGDFTKAGSEAEARRRGLYRLEGKDYIVKDGDIIEFRFNI